MEEPQEVPADEEHERVWERVAAVDIAKASGVVCTRVPDEDLWVPETLSSYATWAYSRIRPPSRSRRRTRIFAPIAGGCERPAGGFCCSVRCGR